MHVSSRLRRVIEKLEQRINFLQKKSSRFSNIRLLVFLIGLIAVISGFFASNIIGWIIAPVFLLCFGIIVHLHNKIIWGIKRTSLYLDIKKANLARCEIDWENIPMPAAHIIPEEMSIEKDLDITGEQSLHRLIDTSVSIEGSKKLAGELRPVKPESEKIFCKQSVIKELAKMQSARDKLILKAGMVSKKSLCFTDLLNLISKVEIIRLPQWLYAASLVLILTYSALFVLYVAEIIPSYYWIIVFLLYFFTYSKYHKRISGIAEESEKLESQIRKFSLLLNEVQKFQLKNNPSVTALLKPLTNGKNSAAAYLDKLRKITSSLLVRENPIMRLIVNVLFPFDIYFCRELIINISNIKSELPDWVKTFNELECCISLSNFASLNSEFTFPNLVSGKEKIFSVKEMGHPMLKKDLKVCNDFSFQKQNEIVIVTGSNMSGKSTFLKTVGVNLCLAYAGAPVNARSFKTSMFRLFTCIKVNDSVVDGISYFYAEVKKLKQLLDRLDDKSENNNLFLIDEIFKGTNNKERLEGSRAYIKELARLSATGFVSTHDLELVNLESEIGSLSNYHFREEISDGKMIFDYKIHKGPCPTTNALKIMKLAGLPVR